MDDINAIVHVEDAVFFMYHFKRLGLPLGAVLNQEKTRVMTSTNGHKLTDLLKASDDPHLRACGVFLPPEVNGGPEAAVCARVSLPYLDELVVAPA